MSGKALYKGKDKKFFFAKVMEYELRILRLCTAHIRNLISMALQCIPCLTSTFCYLRISLLVDWRVCVGTRPKMNPTTPRIGYVIRINCYVYGNGWGRVIEKTPLFTL